jgi:fibronectin type 3 domain-containing protein
MKKNSLFAVMLVMTLALGMFAGCENGVQEIEGSVGINEQKAPQAGAVTYKITDTKQYVIVSWDAAAEDVYYRVYLKQDDKKSYSEVYSSSSPQFVYNRYKPLIELYYGPMEIPMGALPH